MKYESPKCECGNRLFIMEQCASMLFTPLTKKGKRSKRGDYTTGLEHGYLPDTRLDCSECYNQYEIEMDEKDRYVRGKKWEES
jgi:hypothetical protein